MGRSFHRAAYLVPLAGLFFAAGCGGGSHHPAAPAAARAALAPSSSPSASPSASPALGQASRGPSPAASASLSAPVVVSDCPALAAALGSTQGAAGHILDVFTLTNTASTGCTLDGYPSLSLIASDGRSIAAAQAHGSDMAFPAVSAQPVHLAGGAVASFSVGYSDVPTGSASCPTAVSVRITPPGSTAALAVRSAVTVCGRLDVSPVVAGSNGVSG
jgi:hypothetical protein